MHFKSLQFHSFIHSDGIELLVDIDDRTGLSDFSLIMAPIMRKK